MNLTERKIYKLHQKITQGKYKKEMVEIFWTHSQIVKEIALEIAQSLEKNYKIKTKNKLIIIGSLVHDIGCYDCFDNNFMAKKNYIEHGKVGYQILKQNNFTEDICRFALTHIGVGIEKMIPISLEEEIVAYADSFHTKRPVSFNNFENERKKLIGFDPNKGIIFDRFRDKFGIPNLDKIENKYQKWHQKINKWFEALT